MAQDNFYIQKGGYLQFDATTIEQYIKDQLNVNDSKFTDQNFEGSYFSSMIEVISYTFNVLMFYLNQTSSEAMFTDAQLYENMNRIVKMLGYNPIGYQTSIAPYTATAEGLDPDTVYHIPRFSSINAGGSIYSFNKDIVFKGDILDEVVDEEILYQGKFYEYPQYQAEGSSNEVIYLTPGENVIIDHFNMFVYIKDKTGNWTEWQEIESMALATRDSEVFELRYNENRNYELKFGNNINGRELKIGDSVAIYYLQSDGDGNDLTIGALDGIRYVKFASPQFTEIFNQISDTLEVGTLAPPQNIKFNNEVPSTPFSTPESVEDIRDNAPLVLKSKNTLSRLEDYALFISRKYSNIIADVKAIDNQQYTGEYLKYYYKLGVQNTQNVSRILYNQVAFADSCNFNNIYIFAKPTISSTEDYNAFVSPSLKQLMINSMEGLKTTTSEIIICDPVYMAIDIGVNDLSTGVTPLDAINSEFVILKDGKTSRSDSAIITDVNTVFLEYFNQENAVFGMDVSFPDLNDAILSVGGVVGFKVRRTDSGSEDPIEYTGLSMITWNPIYEGDVELLLQSKPFNFFQVPYLYNRKEFINKLVVEVSI